ncbi:MAG TPA: hypothetical protein VGF55_17220 [Gemmataceae bacterium]|jgi:hypothetical protein
MATLGKVLAVFNVLAAIAFLFVAAKDYNSRQSWAYSHFRHQLAVYGLPLDAKDDAWRLPGRTISEQFGKSARAELFPGGSGPATQEEEVTATVQAFKAGVDQATDINGKRGIIATYLLPQLATAEERDAAVAELYALRDQAGVDRLVAQFEDIAKRAVNPQADRETRRRAIADFLYNFGYDAARHQRTQAVVGLEQYVGAAERGIVRMQAVVARDRRVIADEQAAFVAQYQAEVPELTVLAGQLQALEAKLTEQKELVQRHTALKNARTAEVMDYTNKLAAEKQKAAEEFAALAAIQKELFNVQRDWAEAQARNQQLEQELRTRETGK